MIYVLLSVGVKPVIFSDWEKIDSVEMSQGEVKGKPREKLLTVEEMLQVARKWLKTRKCLQVNNDVSKSYSVEEHIDGDVNDWTPLT